MFSPESNELMTVRLSYQGVSLLKISCVQYGFWWLWSTFEGLFYSVIFQLPEMLQFPGMISVIFISSQGFLFPDGADQVMWACI